MRKMPAGEAQSPNSNVTSVDNAETNYKMETNKLRKQKHKGCNSMHVSTYMSRHLSVLRSVNVSVDEWTWFI